MAFARDRRHAALLRDDDVVLAVPVIELSALCAGVRSEYRSGQVQHGWKSERKYQVFRISYAFRFFFQQIVGVSSIQFGSIKIVPK